MVFLSRGSSNQYFLLRCRAHMRPEHNSTTSMERDGDDPRRSHGHNRTNMRGDRNAMAIVQTGASLAVPAIVEKRCSPCSPSSSGVGMVDNQISVGGRIAANKAVTNNGGAYKSGCFASSHLVQVMSHDANAKTTYNSATIAATRLIRSTIGRPGNLRPTHRAGTPMNPRITAHGRITITPRQTRSPAYSNVSSMQPFTALR